MRRACLLVLAACGGDPATPDARPDVMGARCDPNGIFKAPVPVAGLNSPMDDASARLSPDELTVVFARRTGAGTGVFDLYTAKRASRDAAFETPTLLATVNSVNSELWPTLSPDGLLLAFQSDRSTAINHIYTAKRASVSDPFGPPTASPALMDNEDHPYLANGRALYFMSARTPSQGMQDIWRAEIDSTGATSTPTTVLGGVNTPDGEVAPALTEDELHIFFRRTTSNNEMDIYAASRTTAKDGFGTAMPVLGLSMPGVNEIPTWVSPDGCNLYVQIVSPIDGMGGDDLYVARRGSP